MSDKVVAEIESGKLTEQEISVRLRFWASQGCNVSKYLNLLSAETLAALGGPGIFKKAKNFAGAVVKHVTTGMKTCPQDVQEKRLSLCKGCAWFEEGICRHPDCGCNMEAKVKWASSRCPLVPPTWDEYKA